MADAGVFVTKLMKSLPAEAFAGFSEVPVPLEPELRRSFHDRLGVIAACALTPPAESLLGRLTARLIGRVLATLYSLHAPSIRDAVPPASKAAHRNLTTLARAPDCVERGDLRAAVGVLEALTGDCREQAAAWVAETRRALLLQQTLRAVQAKAHCLNASLL
eukprot:TRINITY_DN52658_c0_g1_i1.p1 TRINITY_DN52658_c0_g1~~TRINITY_DN52658_c0_g1_i1.p1  ORF type:complete len:179 (+),score=38.96 TRINITY_DN52658_c0_g1_i1:54-539(+)